MAKLSDLQAASLLEEIACSMQVGMPVIDAMKRLSERRLGRVGRAAGRIAERLDRGESLPDALTAANNSVATRAAAAVTAAERSGDPTLIQRHADLLRARSYFTRETRLAWFYPWVLLAVAYVVGAFVMAPMIRDRQGRDFQWANWVLDTAIWLETNWWIPPLVIAALFVAFLIWLASRSRFPRQVRIALFCESLADQFGHDVPEDEAIRSAAAISGDNDLMSISEPTLKSPRIASLISTSGASSNINEQKQLLIAKLRFEAAVHQQKARRRAYVWARLVPRVAMVLVGGGLTLSYAWWVIAPVYTQVATW